MQQQRQEPQRERAREGDVQSKRPLRHHSPFLSLLAESLLRSLTRDTARGFIAGRQGGTTTITLLCVGRTDTQGPVPERLERTRQVIAGRAAARHTAMRGQER